MLGAGPVGGYFGGRLAHAGENLVFVERGATLRALRDQGLRVDSPDGNFVVRPIIATGDAQTVGAVDVVLVAVKGWQVLPAVETIRPLVGPSTLVVPLMDGVEAPEQLATAFSKDHVVAGPAITLGRSIVPGHIRNRLPHSSITIGELDGGTSERIVRLQSAFQRAGVTATVSADILKARWEKLVLVGPWSAIGAVTRAPLGVVRTLSETRQLLERSIREVVAVARAFGTALSDDVVGQSLQTLDRAPETAIGNMREIIDGRPSELEVEVGAIVRLARRLGVEVPCHSFLYASLVPQERKARGEIVFPIEDEKSASAAYR